MDVCKILKGRVSDYTCLHELSLQENHFTFDSKLGVSSIFQNDHHQNTACQGHSSDSHDYIHLNERKKKSREKRRERDGSKELQIESKESRLLTGKEGNSEFKNTLSTLVLKTEIKGWE